MPGHLNDWIAETPESIAARLEGAREAQRQTRFALGMMALISMMMLIMAYNAYLSFDSGWILERVHEKVRPADQADTVAEILTAQALQDWAASRIATIELLGIRLSVDDAPILGTISLFVFSLWLLLITRRENHTVGSLLRDTDTPGTPDEPESLRQEGSPSDDAYANGKRWLIFHTLIANNVFVVFQGSLERIQSLRGANPLMGKRATGARGRLGRFAMLFARDFFFWFPAVAAAFVFYLDRLSYFQPDPFEPNAAIPGTDAPLFFESIAVFLACWIPLVLCCRGSALYSKATDNVLRDYGERLQGDLSRRQAMQGADAVGS